MLPDIPSQDRITLWARGAAKSTTAETIGAYWGIMRRRRYIWYVCSTQDAANDHVLSLGDLLVSEKIEQYFPSMAERSVDKYGNAEGWRRNRLITAGGFVVDALGLDTAARGRRVGDLRPDGMILDDLDDQFDTPDQTQKKIDTVANKIIMAGVQGNTVVLGCQNVITPTGIFAKFADRTHTILTDAEIDGPIPAIEDLQLKGNEIISGKPTWPEGLGLDQCQRIINQVGLNAFLLESQHDVYQTKGALWTRMMLHHSDLPEQVDEYNIGIDPAMSDGPRADLTGIYVAALKDEDIYLVEEHSGRHHPSFTKKKAFELYQQFQCEVHIETDNGGEWLIDALIEMGIPKNKVIGEKSGGVSKRGRAQPLADKSSEIPSENHLWLCQKFETLENQMVSWVPGPTVKSPDHLDAAVWATAKWLKPKISPMRGYGYAWAQ